MIHIINGKLNRTDLAACPMNRPKNAGSRWEGVPHIALASTLAARIAARGWSISDERYATQRNGEDLVGGMNLEIPGLPALDGMGWSLGLITSNGRRRQTRIVIGTTILVCNNGVATGDVVLAARHTAAHLDLPGLLDGGLDEFVKRTAGVRDMVAGLRSREIDDVELHRALITAGRAGWMPWSRIGDVDAEYRDPRHPEHGTGNAWSLLMAFTEIVKANPAQSQMEQTNKFREHLVSLSA